MRALLFGISIALCLGGCVSSEETGAGDGRAKRPQRVRQPIDTTRAARRMQSAAAGDSAATAMRTHTVPIFTAKQDTIHASQLRRHRTAARVVPPIDRPANPEYTVQIGAFAKPDNALRAQKRARHQFPDQPLFNTYVPSANLYRVSVGRFPDYRSASRFRRAVIAASPKEYDLCWINYVSR